MKIKKTYQGVIPNNKIVNTHSTSQTDAYSCDYTNKLHSYSTEEQVIGKWIDEKPLYRKVINWGALPNTTTVTRDHNILNANFVKIEGYGLYDGACIPLPFTAMTDLHDQISIRVTATQVYVMTGSDRSVFNGIIILEYTKTTDIGEV